MDMIINHADPTVGSLTDFYGNEVRHRRELPGNAIRQLEIDLDGLVPIEGWSVGMEMRSFESEDGAGPVCLYDRWGWIVKQWPDGYMPDREEIRQAVKDELRREGRQI